LTLPYWNQAQCFITPAVLGFALDRMEASIDSKSGEGRRVQDSAVAETIIPYLIGAIAALVLIAVLSVGQRFFKRRPLTRKQHSLLFICIAVQFLASAVFLSIAGRPWWASALSFLAFAILVWAALGNWFEWPGFRPEPDSEEEDGDGEASAPAV
jgi:hypothetical protein